MVMGLKNAVVDEVVRVAEGSNRFVWLFSLGLAFCEEGEAC